MKIAVTSTGPTLDDVVETRFGRSTYFLIIDPDTLDFEALPNPNLTLGGGAGPQSAQLMANKEVSVVLTGNCGPNAFQTFGAAGIEVITGVSGQVRQAVEQFNSGKLANVAALKVQSHFGMGMGRGMGRGMARGKGMGGGTGTSPWGSANQPESSSLSKREELKRLKDQANELRKQVDAIESAIEALEKE
jgi:predicted Fe-Mo cluster-binding NifX family protein